MRKFFLIIAFLCSVSCLNANDFLMEIPLDDNYTKEQPTDPDPVNDRNLSLIISASINRDFIMLNSNLSISNFYFYITNANNCIIFSAYSAHQSISHTFNNINLAEDEEYTIFVVIGDSCYSGSFAL